MLAIALMFVSSFDDVDGVEVLVMVVVVGLLCSSGDREVCLAKTMRAGNFNRLHERRQPHGGVGGHISTSIRNYFLVLYRNADRSMTIVSELIRN